MIYYYFVTRRSKDTQKHNASASKKKGKSRRKILFDFGRGSSSRQEEEGKEVSESQNNSQSSSTSSEDGSTSQLRSRKQVPMTEKDPSEAYIPGGFKRHVTSPSLEKALPALPPPSPHLEPAGTEVNIVESPLDNGLLPAPILPKIKRASSSSSSASELPNGAIDLAQKSELGQSHSQQPPDNNEGESDDEGDNDMKDAPANRKKGRRRKRGKRPAAKYAVQAANTTPTDEQDGDQQLTAASAHVVVDQDKDIAGKVGSLVVSDKIIGESGYAFDL
jgi:hypothetical protein